VLGRIATDQFLAGEMPLEAERAAAAVDRVALALGSDRVSAAQGIVRVANANMERAIRVVSVERGRDPRDFPLIAFGGCGGLHACEMAEELGIRTVIVPRFAGALSALGMLLADRMRDYSAGVLDATQLENRFRQLERTARRDMPGAKLARMADVRYVGQSYELTIPWGASFHEEHQRIYGYADPERPTEIVTVRVRSIIAARKPVPAHMTRSVRRDDPEIRRIFTGGKFRKLPVFSREQVRARGEKGPALIADYGATTLIPAGWRFTVDRVGNLVAGR
jgi:N-methylhydantoinase A